MRLGSLLAFPAALTGVFTLAACGGGDRTAAGNNPPATNTGAAGAPANNAAAQVTAVTGPAAAMLATGRVVDVKMLGDDKGYRFEPANVTIKAGDAVRWTNVSGGPHNVTFWADSIPAGARPQLVANMPNTTEPLAGPLLTDPNAVYVVSFAGLKSGVYHYYCTPHLALGMRATVTVQ